MNQLTVRSRAMTPAQEIKMSAFEGSGLHRVISKALATRGVEDVEEALGQYRLESFNGLRDIHTIAEYISEGILKKERFIVVADYDCDGATACAVAVSGLRALGADIDFVVPNRFIHGYGLTPSVVDVVAPLNPRWIITVDNGIASNAGVDAAHAKGIGVLVTDHHLPGDIIPPAEAIVNPNHPDCSFPSKSLAGVGVMYYVLGAVREKLKSKNALPPHAPALAQWLDLVALGTVADVVKLDANNRWLVRQGLKLIRSGHARPGVKALFEIARKDISKASAQDFGFGLGPRINAAGRLEDMTIGIRCLLSETLEEARQYAEQLNDINERRKSIEKDMKESAWETIGLENQAGRFTRVVYDESFHEGVIGIVAGRIKEEENVPVLVFAPSQEEGYLKGSGRSIPGLHLRDALDLVHKRGHDLFYKFGGHAMAAGVTLKSNKLNEFTILFEQAVQEMMEGVLSQKEILVDEELPFQEMTLDLADLITDQVWGQAFEEPVFEGYFKVLESRLLGVDAQHLKLVVQAGPHEFEALHFFNQHAPTSSWVRLIYRLSRNDFRGQSKLNLMVLQKFDV